MSSKNEYDPNRTMPHDMTWYESGKTVSFRDKSPLGALSTRKTNIANTVGQVSFRVVKATIVHVGLNAFRQHNCITVDLDCQTNIF